MSGELYWRMLVIFCISLTSLIFSLFSSLFPMNRINHETEGFKWYFLNSVICKHLYYAVAFSGF